MENGSLKEINDKISQLEGESKTAMRLRYGQIPGAKDIHTVEDLADIMGDTVKSTWHILRLGFWKIKREDLPLLTAMRQKKLARIQGETSDRAVTLLPTFKRQEFRLQH